MLVRGSSWLHAPPSLLITINIYESEKIRKYI